MERRPVIRRLLMLYLVSFGSSTNTKPASTVVCPFTNGGIAALEEVLIRVVVPVLKAGDQMTGDLALDGPGELVQMLPPWPLVMKVAKPS